MSVSPQKTKGLLKFNKVFFTTVFIVVPGILLDALTEYNSGGANLYFMRAIVNLAFVAIALVLHSMSKLGKTGLLTVSVYSVVLLMMSTLTVFLKSRSFSIAIDFCGWYAGTF